MKISTVLDHIDNGHMALPEFQRGYVWNREQVRGLFDSLYRRHPIGGLLVWATESQSAEHRGDGELAAGIVKLLLDGQQRMTTLYGVIRGKAPKFFDGNASTFTGLFFHLENEIFEFYQPLKMKDDKLWIDVTQLMKKGDEGLGEIIARLSQQAEFVAKTGEHVGKLAKLLGIREVDLHVEEVTGSDKTIDVVVEIFNRVNSGGTKLSKGDLALAKICAEWPDAREKMKEKLKTWENIGYHFSLDWLLRSVNTVITGEAKFLYLHDKNPAEVQNGLERAGRHLDSCLNMISGRLGLDHDQVLFSRYSLPVMVRYLDKRNGLLDAKERDKLLFWFVQAGMWGRFSGSTESIIDKDLEVLENDENMLDNLLENLRMWHSGLRIEPYHFTGWSLGARFYPVLYMLTRMGEARDWGNGLPLKAHMHGKMSKLEVHHIFPKAKLYKHNNTGYKRPEVNALANYCFLTKETNLFISDRYPEEYFPEIERNHPGALASQWIPEDPNLWKIENYLEFLEARKVLIANEANKQMDNLLHGELHWLDTSAPVSSISATLGGGITTEQEELELNELNNWISSLSLPRGTLLYEHYDLIDNELKAVFDLAWPSGLQEEYSQPVAILLNEEEDLVKYALESGFKCFTKIDDFKKYVSLEII